MTEPTTQGNQPASRPSAPSYQPVPAAEADLTTTRPHRGSPTYVPKASTDGDTSPGFKGTVAAAAGAAAGAVAGAASTAVASASNAVSTAKDVVADLRTPAGAPPPPTAKPRTRRTRKARLRIARVDPWSVMKTALLFGIAGGIIFVVATYVVMSVIESTGVYQAINQVVADMLTAPTDTQPFTIETYINTRRVTGLAALIGAVDVVIFTALATVFSFLYNLSATMLGGLEITLAED